LGAGGEEVMADALDDEGEFVATDVGVGVDEDVRGGAEGTERLEDSLYGAAFVAAGV
jgi:hypothetical protein